MRQLVYDPSRKEKMTVVCFVSGSGTNYREIVRRDPDHLYIVFTNRPGCGGTGIARENNHEVIELSHVPYLRDVRAKYGAGKVPRNCDERVRYEQELAALIEDRIGGEPDLICLAGYDQWTTDWLVDRYYPRILNVHPGDTTRGYDGLHWVPSAKAILAGDAAIRSTLFFVDKGEDTGPVLAQSRLLDIAGTLAGEDAARLTEVTAFARARKISTYPDFKEKAGQALQTAMAGICEALQEALKVTGDWQIYPLAVHDLIARGRVEIDDRTVYVDGREMPAYGYRIDENE
jgi:phosphoribosylglycinamide formyltransferase-1